MADAFPPDRGGALLDRLSGLRGLGYNLRSHIDHRVGNALNAGGGHGPLVLRCGDIADRHLTAGGGGVGRHRTSVTRPAYRPCRTHFFRPSLAVSAEVLRTSAVMVRSSTVVPVIFCTRTRMRSPTW